MSLEDRREQPSFSCEIALVALKCAAPDGVSALVILESVFTIALWSYYTFQSLDCLSMWSTTVYLA